MRQRRVLVLAQEEARLLHSSKIGTEHLLLGLIQGERPGKLDPRLIRCLSVRYYAS